MLVKDIVVSLAVTAALNVVCNCNAAIDTPPTGNLTSLNLTWSLTCRPLLKNDFIYVIQNFLDHDAIHHRYSIALYQ